jgi:hypothetical protein
VENSCDEVRFGPWASELGKRSVLAYRRDLPQLLQERPNWWVAYYGDERVGLAKNPAELHERCQRRGLPRGDYVVRLIEPLPPDVVDLDY